MQTAGGTLGTVVWSSTGQIAGALRFAPASMAPILAPVLAYQVLHAIAGTIQLRKINSRLDIMQRKLETLQARQEAAVLGEVRWAARVLDDILAERANTGTFTPDMDTRLAQIEKTIGSILERNRALVELFRDKSKAVQTVAGKAGAAQATALLQEEGRQVAHDMELLIGVVAADMRVEEARLFGTMERNPKDAERRLDRINKKLTEYRKALDDFPSLEELASHAKASVKDMDWWDRNIVARGLVKEVEKLTELGIRDVRRVESGAEAPAASSYVFWKDHSGVTHIRMLPSEALDGLPAYQGGQPGAAEKA